MNCHQSANLLGRPVSATLTKNAVRRKDICLRGLVRNVLVKVVARN